jgi:hypothetical protein
MRSMEKGLSEVCSSHNSIVIQQDLIAVSYGHAYRSAYS